MHSKSSFLLKTIQGMIIGSAGMIPGASGGVFAVVFGVYQKFINILANPFASLLANLRFMLPYCIGAAIGFLFTARILSWLITNHHAPLMYALIGMVLGGIPALVRSAKAKFNSRHIVFIAMGAAVTALIALLDGDITGTAALPFNAFTAMLSGAILSIGIVIPGVSTSFILMYFGLYQPMLQAVNRLDIPMLACAVLGGCLMGLLLIKFVQKMFFRHNEETTYCILGFLLGTVLLIFPGFAPFPGQLFLLLLMALGFVLSLYLEKLA